MAKVDVIIDLNAAKAIKAFDKFEGNAKKSVSKINNKVNSLTSNIQKIGAAFAAVAVGSFLKDSVAAFDAQEKAVASVRQGLELTKDASGKTLDGLLDQASELQKNSLFGDEQILNDVSAQFLTFGNISDNVFDRAQQAALDLATKLGTDLKGNAIQLGKALDDPIRGMSALARSGVTFTDAQKSMVKSLVKSGDILGAQNIVLGEIESKYGGAAAAAAKAGSGPLKQIQMRFADITELVGAALLPAISKVGVVFESIATSIENNKQLFIDIITAIGIFIGIIGTVILLTKVWSGAQFILNAIMAANPISLIIIGIAALIAIIAIVVKKYEGWGASFAAIGEIMKITWTGIKDSFKTAFKLISLDLDLLLEKFKFFKDFVKNIFTGIGAAAKAFFSGDFEGAGAAFKNMAPDDSSIRAIEEAKNKIRSDFEDRSYKRDLKRGEQLANIGLKRKVDTSDSGNGKPFINPLGDIPTSDTPSSSVKEGLVSGNGKSSKSITLNIDRVVENLTITQNQDPLEVKSLIEKALMSALSNVSQFA